MRPALGVLALLLSAGCSCSRDHVDDHDDGGGSTIDGSLDDGSALPGDADTDGALDAARDGGTPDPTTCEGFAEALCARYEACDLELIWIYGSRERCETNFRAECEHEDTLERTGDLDAARVALIDSLSLTECGWVRDEEDYGWFYARPPGTGNVGDPCRSSIQCGEAVTADGRTVRMHCYPETYPESACDSGVCELPLAEGATDCAADFGDRCDASLDLHCVVTSPDDPTTQCAVRTSLGEGEACPIGTLESGCADDLVCGPTGVCERFRTNGESCDPDTFRHCGGYLLPYCDPETRTCMLNALAFEGEACGRGPGEPVCGRNNNCVEGICERIPGFRMRGETCDETETCWRLACVDGVCGSAPCE